MFALESTPSYKILSHGTAALSDAEILSVIIANGQTVPQSSNAHNLAVKILQASENNLFEIGRLSFADLSKLGATEAQAKRVICALEIGRRRQLSDIRTKPRISGSRDAFNVIGATLADLHNEEFWMLILNRANEVTHRVQMSIGGTSGTVVDLKMIFKLLLEKNAAGFIAVHNHPSGNLEPSNADIELTKRMVNMGRTLDLPCLDHLIISHRGYYSFADEGMI